MRPHGPSHGEEAGPERRVPRLFQDHPPLVLADQAAKRPFYVEAGVVRIGGPERADVARIQIHSRTVVSDVHTGVGAAVNLVLAPDGIRRERVGAAGTVLEAALAVPTLPMAVLQWSAPPGAPPLPPMKLSCTLCPHVSDAEHEVADGRILVRDPARPEEVVAVVLDPVPEEVEIAQASGGGLEMRATLSSTGPLSLVVVAGPSVRLPTLLRAIPHLGNHERSAHNAVHRLRSEHLHLDTGVVALDDGVEWCKARVVSAIERVSEEPDVENAAAWLGLAALAMGDFGGAEKALAALRERAPDTPLPTLLAARATLATGNPGPALHAFRSLEVRPPEDARWSGALEFLADALRYNASEEETARLRTRAAALRASTRDAESGGVRLPMAGSTGRSPGAGGSGLVDVLAEAGLSGLRDPRPAAVESWVTAVRGDTLAAFADWRSELQRAFLPDGSGPRGHWHVPSDDPDGLAPAVTAARLICALVHGILGWEPDAPSGRGVLAPRLPAHLASWTVHSLSLGDVRLSMEYARGGNSGAFTLTPTTGSVPPIVVLRPTLPWTTVSRAEVDGADAELDVHPVPRGCELRIQLPLDAPRRLVVEGG